MKNRSVLIICVIAIVITAILTTCIVYNTLSSSPTDIDSNSTTANETSIINTQNTTTSSEDISSEYPEYSPTFGHYKILGHDFEAELIETSDGDKYVLGGDGYYTYAGTDSNGHYELGSYVGKY